MKLRKGITSSVEEFHIDPRMADTVAQYLWTFINNLEEDPDMDEFLSEEEMNVLREAHGIATDVASALTDPDEW